MLFLFGKFKLKKWTKCSYDKRFKCFVEAEKRIAKEFNIEPLKLELKYEDWNCFGAFMILNDEKVILLNASLIHEPQYRFHALETIAHETRHAYQHSIVSKKLKWYEFTAKKWQRNWEGYISSSADSVLYNNQAIERDAQKYSIKYLKRLRGKYQNEPHWKETFNAVVDRYEYADEIARKKYGIFYKYKMDKKIKENSKY